MEWIRCCRAEIDLDNIIHNYELCRDRTGADIIAVVKANAYGHGADETARLLSEAGCKSFAVSNITEAVSLRKSGCAGDIIIMGYTPPEQIDAIIDCGIIQTVYCYEYAAALHAQAAKSRKVIPVHLKLDTGMGRIGLRTTDAGFAAEVKQLFALDRLEVLGVYTHFAAADKDTAYTRRQAALFDEAVREIRSVRRSASALKLHCCNSAAAFFYPEYRFDAVRIGIALYGISPVSAPIDGLPLKAAMTLKSVLSMVKPLKKGDSVSYDRTFIAQKDMVIATVPIGYADGYSRKLSGAGIMSIKGKPARVLGRVTMDQCMADVTDIDCHRGDEAVLFGVGGMSAEEVAALSGTVSYEVVCGISARVPRVYYLGGKAVSIRHAFY